MAQAANKYERVIQAVKVIRPGETFRHYLSPEEARERGAQIVCVLGTTLRNHVGPVSLRRYEHIIVITKLEA